MPHACSASCAYKKHTAVPYAVDRPLKGKLSDIFKPCKAKANFEDLFDLI